MVRVGGGESFTHPEGRSQSLASDLALKEGNLGEGERNVSEQSEQWEQRVTDTRSTPHNVSTLKAGPPQLFKKENVYIFIIKSKF